MKQKVYLGIYAALLIILGITFIFQVKAFGTQNPFQWLALVVIAVIGLASYFIGRRMKKESWFVEMQKKKK